VAISLALLGSWCIAAARPLASRTAWKELAGDRTAEREGLIALGCVVVAFGVQSAVDWTWFFTGVAVPALVCAGWLAGRGPLVTPVGRAPVRQPILQRPGASAAVTALAALTLVLAWFTWQPLRSADALSASVSAAASGDSAQAFAEARDSARIDPVTIEPLQILSSLYAGAGDVAAARAELVDATQRQPDNPETWLSLGQFEIQHGQTRRAYRSLLRALRLNPLDPVTGALVIEARVKLGIPPPKS
jgi:cytochrome c-type biogenesis protein CcmH/NrfG